VAVVKNLLAGLALLGLVPGCAFALERVVVAAFEYPPIYQDGPEKGLSGDLVAAAFQAVGIGAEFRFFPVARMVQAVANGDYACGMGGSILFESPVLASRVALAATVNYVSQVFVYDTRRFSPGPDWKSLAELSDYRIGVLRSSGINKFLEKTVELKLETNTIHEGSAQQLQKHRIDLWAIVDLTGMMYLGKLFPAEAAHFKYTKAYNRGDVSLVVSRKLDPDGLLAARFREGLAIIKKNGVYLKILAHYYGGADRINREALSDDLR
jgi:ABC-type amino acid transport substrate-binding protein